MFPEAVRAAEQLREEGLEVGVINARFIKPLDTETILQVARETGFLLAVEENVLAGGFGSAVLETINAAGEPTNHVRCLGIPDQFVEHGNRDELLTDLGLDAAGIATMAHSLSHQGSYK